ncbi:TnsA endonuclease N-terminal domain-containing protein [Peribacillus frigoritolerans]|uniref:TnsA endonuclease N-terminal domain-containing protein n=1 Tax=Peribacillus frigoritolerans TaxID=450367 RepID=UPI00399F4D21
MGYKKWSDKTIEKMIKNGCGSGTGQEYTPWIHIKDVPSEGKGNRPLGWKTNRTHQFLSNLEFYVFLAYEWSDNIVDIREQFPLDRNKTVELAEKLSIKHSVYLGTDVNIVMTTDFLLTVKTESGNKQIVRSVKPADKMSDRRTIEKLQLEKAYWEKQGVDWRIITEKDIDEKFSKNMLWLHNQKGSMGIPFKQEMILLLINELKTFLFESNETFLDCFARFENHFNLPGGTAILLFRHSLANKNMKVKDMFVPIDLTKEILKILDITRVEEREGDMN